MKKIILGGFIFAFLHHCTQPKVQEDVTFCFASEETIRDVDIIGKDTFYFNEYHYGIIRNDQYDTLTIVIDYVKGHVNKVALPNISEYYVSDTVSNVDMPFFLLSKNHSKINIGKHEEAILLFKMPYFSDSLYEYKAYNYAVEIKDSSMTKYFEMRIFLKNGLYNDPVKVEMLE